VQESLFDLGLLVHLGHQGRACATPLKEGRPTLTVIDVTGIHTVRVKYCGCKAGQKGYERREQLMRSAWFPATWVDPRTVFTYEVLNDFHVSSSLWPWRIRSPSNRFSICNRRPIFTATGEHFSVSSTTLSSGQTLYVLSGVLREVPQLTMWQRRYNEFSCVMRQYRHLVMLKRAGRVHDPELIISTLGHQLRFECPACPHDGKNLPDGWEKDPLTYVEVDCA
jgi:hypothetical protein